MKALFPDATEGLAEVFRAMRRNGNPAIDVTIQAQVAPRDLPAMQARYGFILDDQTALPMEGVQLTGKAIGLIAGNRTPEPGETLIRCA